MINAGRLNGLGVGMTVRIYEIGKLNKNPFTGELIGIDEVVIGEWKVIRADDRTSMCRAVRTSKGRTVNVGQYVGFEPSEKIVSSMAATRERILAQLEREWSGMDAAAQREASQKATGGKPTKQSSLPKPSRGRVEFDGGWGWSHYSLNSDSYDLNQNVSSFPVIRAAGEYWVIPSVGIDADYQIGFFKLDSQGGSSISAKARPTWITTNLMYRWFFSPGHANLELIGRAGYAWYNYHLSETNSQYLINARYRGLNLGIEVRLPISTNFSAEFGTDYQPAVAVTEEPATSGENPSAWALEAHAELLYRLDRGLWMSIRYQIENYSASFSGTGTRAGGISGAKTSDQLNNVSLGLVFQF